MQFMWAKRWHKNPKPKKKLMIANQNENGKVNGMDIQSDYLEFFMCSMHRWYIVLIVCSKRITQHTSICGQSFIYWCLSVCSFVSSFLFLCVFQNELICNLLHTKFRSFVRSFTSTNAYIYAVECLSTHVVILSLSHHYILSSVQNVNYVFGFHTEMNFIALIYFTEVCVMEIALDCLSLAHSLHIFLHVCTIVVNSNFFVTKHAAFFCIMTKFTLSRKKPIYGHKKLLFYWYAHKNTEERKKSQFYTKCSTRIPQDLFTHIHCGRSQLIFHQTKSICLIYTPRVEHSQPTTMT